MKTLLPFLLLAVSFFNVNGQFKGVGDTTEVELITFESESVFFQQGTPTTNIWQIGEPSKLTFTESYSLPNAIVTDTLNAYPANNHSWFDLQITSDDFGYYYVGIEFLHKINSDTLCDGGYITVSYDNGELFSNIINDSLGYWYIFPKNENENLYKDTDTLYNGEFGFSGNINSWIKVKFCWYDLVTKNTNWFDPMIIRFNFLSDATETARDGWMIDDIRLFWVDLGGNIHEKPLVSNIEVYPNPIIDNAIIKSKNNREIQKIDVFSITGELLRRETIGTNEFIFNKRTLQKGTYLVKCYYGNNDSETIKMQID
ncbi:MAG: T9SS type A sorting domain-containing protein [Salinivirgaceae bacterium]|nr:T9SS type A sorting domain-containing protein [Salinivirgaceae bacterium]